MSRRKPAFFWIAVLSVASALLIPFIANGQPKPAEPQATPCPKPARPIDQPAISIQLVVKGQPPRKVGDAGTLDIVLRPNMPVSGAALDVSGAGVVALDAGKELQPLSPEKSFLPNVPIRTRVRAQVRELKVGGSENLSIPFRVPDSGYGYFMVKTLGPDGEPSEASVTAVLYVLSLPDRVYFSQHSLQDLDVQRLEADLKRQGKSPAEIRRQVEKFKRSGARTEKGSHPGSRKSESKDDGGPYNSITVEGHVRFTDVNGTTHPVRFVEVQILDDEGAGPEELVTTTHTDDAGFYTATVDDNDGDGSGRDIVVRVPARGDTIQVVDNASGNVLEIDSEAPVMDVADGTTQTIDVTATNNAGSPQNVAFEVYEALNRLSRYLTVLGEPLPAQMNVRLFSTGAFYAGGEVNLPATEVHFWDTMYHEYGHHIQDVYHTADNPGGPHASCNSDCVSLGSKDAGIRMSWAESWPTFFGSMAQVEMGLGALGIPNLGDTSYTAGNGVNYDLEVEADGCTRGEGSERVLMRILWDLYDAANDDQDQGVALGTQALWDVVVDNQPLTFSAFWNALIAGRPQAERESFARILTRYGVSVTVTAPPAGQDYDGTGPAPTFQWNAPVSCDTGGNARYSVKFYNDALTSLLYETPWQSGTSFTPSADQLNQIFVGPDAPVRWLVTFRDLSDPVTGNYDGGDRTVDDLFNPPDRNPVDIVLALDVSGSMGLPVPGSTLNLQKLALLQQAVELFVRTWAIHAIPNDRIGVLYFSTNLSTVPGLAGLVDVPANSNALIASVNGQTPQVCTAIGGVIQSAFQLLSGGDHKKVIILFTDGEQTHNPMVDEEGVPSKLKIKQLAGGATVPFGGYWCLGATAATDPAGAAVVPDGQLILDHGIQIHTIGVGVGGATFEDLIDRVSSETSALHHFTSAPDEDLDIFFTNDLINSLKTASLEIVKTDRGALGRAMTQTLSVPVNASSTFLSLVISWKGEVNPSAMQVTVRAPNGSLVAPTKADQGGFYKVLKYEFPLKVKRGPPPSPVGNWSVTLASRASTDALLYQLTAFVDERCFHYDFGFERQEYGPGDAIRLTATLTQKGKPLPKADGVWVDVTAPTYSANTVLAAALSRAKATQGGPDMKPSDSMKGAGDLTPFDRMVASVIGSDPRLAEQLRAKTSTRVALYDDGRKEHGDAKAGDGIHSNLLAATQVAGPYQFRFHVLTPTACGRVERTETTGTQVMPRTFDAKLSCITVKVQKTLATLTVRPQDRFGNLLGAGKAGAIDVLVSTGRLQGPVVDNLDGTYSQVIELPAETMDSRVAVVVKGIPLVSAPLSRLSTQPPAPKRPRTSRDRP